MYCCENERESERFHFNIIMPKKEEKQLVIIIAVLQVIHIIDYIHLLNGEQDLPVNEKYTN